MKRNQRMQSGRKKNGLNRKKLHQEKRSAGRLFSQSLFLLFCLLFFLCDVQAAAKDTGAEKSVTATTKADAAKDTEDWAEAYPAYQKRLAAVERTEDIGAQGFRLLEEQVFSVNLESFGEVTFLPALETEYDRFLLFLADGDGRIVFKTDQLETNQQVRGSLRQTTEGLAAVSFQDLNGDGLTDIVLITSCMADSGGSRKGYKTGDVLFQSRSGFYRDWRLSDKLNRFSMNKSVEFITSFVRGGYSTEFLYTAASLDELLEHGFQIISEQCYWRDFEKLGRLLVVPGSYSMAEYEIFLIYLVNEQGLIVWSCQPMGEYDNLYALKGVTCRDIDGDGMKDIVVLARYSSEGAQGELVIESDYEIYYQRTGGFYADTEMKKRYRCGEEDTMEALVKEARACWGWQVQEEVGTNSASRDQNAAGGGQEGGRRWSGC